MKNIKSYMLSAVALLLVACGPSLPGKYNSTGVQPSITPDYAGVTIPCNIAPLVFEISEQGSDFVTKMSAGEYSVLYSGKEVAPSMEEWSTLVNAAVGGSIEVDVYSQVAGTWRKFDTFDIAVSPDTIDRYISYRLIPPSYVAYI